jgi:hypothetical protein
MLSERLEPYSKWLTHILALTGLLITSIPFMWTHILGFDAPSLPKAPLIADVSQVFIICLLMLFCPSAPKFRRAQANDKIVAAQIVTSRFIGCWNSLWFLMLLFYVIKAGARLFGVYESEPIYLGRDFVSLIETALLLLCYICMVVPERAAGDAQPMRLAFRILIVCSIFILAEWSSVRHNKEFIFYFDGMQGLFSGVVLALFVGRLESKLIDSSRWMIVALYAYAVLQLAYPIYESADASPATYLVLASLFVVFKVLLFWEVRRVIHSRYMTYYLIKILEIDESVMADRKKVLQELHA